MPEKKMQVIDDPMKAMAKAGHSKVVLPPDADPEGFVPTEPQQPDPEPVVEETGSPVDTPPAEPQEPAEPTETGSPEMSWEDRAKLWQSNYEKQRTASKEEAERLKQENELLRAVMTRTRPAEPVPAQPTQPVPEIKEPMLEDYIGEDYEAADAFDARTKSGKAYQKFMRDRDRWFAQHIEEQAVQRVRQETETDRKRTLVQQRGERLVSKYPQYRDPLTGEIDFPRINRELFASAQDDPDDWLMYAEFLEFKKGVTPDNGVTTTPDMVSQIEKTASLPSSVVTSTPSTRKPERKVPDKLNKLASVWGQLELPPDAEIDV
jgi:hypothetical protein